MSLKHGQSIVDSEVAGLLRHLVESVQAVLGSHFVGAYLFGSLTTGYFDRNSDIDVLMVTDERLTEDLFVALRNMHEQISLRDSWWATQLEVSYIPRSALRRHDPTDSIHPHLDRNKGEVLHLMRHDSDWVIQRHGLRERGVTLAGPDPQMLIDPISATDLRQAMLDLLWWLEEILDMPEQVKTRGYQSYLVLTMCRVLYTLQYGTVAPKPVAARWAQENLAARWRPLIERAIVGRQNPQSLLTSGDLKGTLEFIQHTLARGRNFEMPAVE